MFNHHNALVITAAARQGKSRFLDELIYLNPKDIPFYKIKLTKSDQNVPCKITLGFYLSLRTNVILQIPHSTIRKFFAVPLGITPGSSTKDRQDRLLIRLRKMQIPELICLVNPIFNVNFEKTALFGILSDIQRKVATEKMIKQLCFGVGISVYLIIVFHI